MFRKNYKLSIFLLISTLLTSCFYIEREVYESQKTTEIGYGKKKAGRSGQMHNKRFTIEKKYYDNHKLQKKTKSWVKYNYCIGHTVKEITIQYDSLGRKIDRTVWKRESDNRLIRN